MNIIKFIIKLVTWPFVFFFFMIICLIWLISWGWGAVDKDVDKELKRIGCLLFHFKQKEGSVK